MRRESLRGLDGWAALAAGVLWSWVGARHGASGLALAFLPGLLLVASGGARLLWPADRRLVRFVALAAVLGGLLAIPGSLVFPLATAAGLLASCGAAFVAAGDASLRADPPRPCVPAARRSVEVAARVAVDETVLAGQGLIAPRPSGAELERMRREVDTARELFARRGWLAAPLAYHRAPPLLEDPRLDSHWLRRARGRVAYQALTFESGYQPEVAEPGCDRWSSYAANRTAHAVVLRHAGAPRPWLVCVHGYLMGATRFGLWIFDAIRQHLDLGLNVALPVLPFHGPRRVGRWSGEGFLGGDVLDTVHAVAQTVWDVRRLLGWIRAQGSPALGLHGVSLGGYHAALLAGIEGELSCVIAGIPASDLARLVWHHAPIPTVRAMECLGLVQHEVAELFRVVSPLAFAPRVPHPGRAIYAGIGDRLIPADQPRALWEHWDRPRVVWMQGGHDPRTREARGLVVETLRASLVAG